MNEKPTVFDKIDLGGYAIMAHAGEDNPTTQALIEEGNNYWKNRIRIGTNLIKIGLISFAVAIASTQIHLQGGADQYVEAAALTATMGLLMIGKTLVNSSENAMKHPGYTLVIGAHHSRNSNIIEGTAVELPVEPE